MYVDFAVNFFAFNAFCDTSIFFYFFKRYIFYRPPNFSVLFFFLFFIKVRSFIGFKRIKIIDT